MNNVYGKRSNGWWQCRETRVLSAGAQNGTHSGPQPEQCEDIADSDGQAPAGQAGGENGTATGTTGNEPTEEEREQHEADYQQVLEDEGLA